MSRLVKLPTINPQYRKPLAALLGALGGFAYYYYIGCASGTCPITGNPWISTAYGALIGWIAAPRKPKTSAASQQPGKEAP